MSDKCHRSVGNKNGNSNVILREGKKAKLIKLTRKLTRRRWFPGVMAWTLFLLWIYIATRNLPLQP